MKQPTAFSASGAQISCILNALRKDQQEHQADPSCPNCQGRGCTWVANGPDDVDPELCQCVINTFK